MRRAAFAIRICPGPDKEAQPSHRTSDKGAFRAMPPVCQSEPHRNLIGIDDRVNLAGQSTSWPAHRLCSVPINAGMVLMHAHNRCVDHLHGRNVRRPGHNFARRPATSLILLPLLGAQQTWEDVRFVSTRSKMTQLV